jgi:hypothetical protein
MNVNYVLPFTTMKVSFSVLLFLLIILGSYLAHTQGRRHQMNISRRAHKDARDGLGPVPLAYVSHSL